MKYLYTVYLCMCMCTTNPLCTFLKLRGSHTLIRALTTRECKRRHTHTYTYTCVCVILKPISCSKTFLRDFRMNNIKYIYSLNPQKEGEILSFNSDYSKGIHFTSILNTFLCLKLDHNIVNLWYSASLVSLITFTSVELHQLRKLNFNFASS